MRVLRVAAPLGIVAGALALAGCGGTAQPIETVPPVQSAAPSSPNPTPASSASPYADAEPTCDTIIPADTAADFAGAGLTVQAEEFRIGATVLPGGLQCTWGNHDLSTDQVQIFGWAPVDPDLADTAQDDLLRDGWQREDGAEGVYITESAATIIDPDADGYGLTYLFGPGWVKFADTKQNLLLVEWPPTP